MTDTDTIDAWRADAACIGLDPGLFVPDAEQIRTRGRKGYVFTIDPVAAAACASCPVAVECAAWASDDEEACVVAAGELTPGDRHRGPTRFGPPCGTNEGYRAHYLNGQEQCQPCRDAHARWHEFVPRRRRSTDDLEAAS